MATQDKSSSVALGNPGGADVLKAEREELAAQVDAALSHQLKYFLAKADVPLKDQAKLAKFGVKTVQSFAMLEDTKKDVRAMLKDTIQIEDALVIGLLVSVWKTCLDFEEKESEAVAVSHAQGIFHNISPVEHTQLRVGYEALIGEKLPKDEVPSKAMLSAVLDNMHVGDPRPTPLDEVANAQEPEVVTETTNTDLQGYTRVVRKRVKGTMPRQQEELRAKMQVEAHAWCMVALKFPNIAWLKDISTKESMQARIKSTG